MTSEAKLKRMRKIALCTEFSKNSEFSNISDLARTLAGFVLELTRELLDLTLIKQIKEKEKELTSELLKSIEQTKRRKENEN